MDARLAISDGLPLWRDPPLRENIYANQTVAWLYNEPCVVLFEVDNGTAAVIYAGELCWAVSEFLLPLVDP